MINFGTVGPPYWGDRPVVIVCGGPTLIGFNFERLRPFHVLAVKASMFDIAFAEVGFGLDAPRYHEWKDRMAALPFPVYWAISEESKGEFPVIDNVTLIKRRDGAGLSDDPGLVYAGGTSGFAALNFARLKRAKTIILLGYDYCPSKGDEDVWHHNEQHYDKKRAQSQPCWALWARMFDKIVPRLDEMQVRVINATTRSWIDCFQRMSVDDALDLHRL